MCVFLSTPSSVARLAKGLRGSASFLSILSVSILPPSVANPHFSSLCQRLTALRFNLWRRMFHVEL